MLHSDERSPVHVQRRTGERRQHHAKQESGAEATLYAVNPFVFDRLYAGQLGFLLG